MHNSEQHNRPKIDYIHRTQTLSWFSESPLTTLGQENDVGIPYTSGRTKWRYNPCHI